MSESVPLLSPPGVDGEPVPVASLDSESRFYGGYAWGLNAYPTVREVVDHLREEVRRLPALDDDWRRGEGLTNVFMLCCALADALDDYLLGVTYDFSKVSAVLPLAAPCVRVTHMALGALRKARERRQVRLRRWAESWRAAVHDFVKLLVAAEAPGRETLVRLGARLTALLDAGLPADLETRRPTAPAAFRTQDLTHFDVLALGRSFVSRFSDRGRPILLVGFRTAGSYFAPVLAAFLTTQGYQRLDFVTIRPKKGIDSWERAMLTRYAKAGGLAVLVDESPATAATLAKGVSEVRKVGFRASDVVPAPRPSDSAGVDTQRRLSAAVRDRGSDARARTLLQVPAPRALCGRGPSQGVLRAAGVHGCPRRRESRGPAPERRAPAALGREVPYPSQADLRGLPRERGQRPEADAVRSREERRLGLAELSRVPRRAGSFPVRPAGPRIA